MSGEYAFTKTYPDKEHFLDALYRLWMMPEMTKRIHVIGGLKYDIEFEEHTSVYACEGIRTHALPASIWNSVIRTAKTPSSSVPNHLRCRFMFSALAPKISPCARN